LLPGINTTGPDDKRRPCTKPEGLVFYSKQTGNNYAPDKSTCSIGYWWLSQGFGNSNEVCGVMQSKGIDRLNVEPFPILMKIIF
jgi:hypothetical protein